MTLDETLLCIKHAFESGRLAQAYVVIGPPRTEGLAFTNRALQMLFCEKADGPCGVCRGCMQAAAHTHPDILWIEPQKKSRIISVDQVRELQARVYKTSYAAGWKACVVFAADRLNESASNAFLKTLEEPPPRSVFFLPTDSPQFLLPTIRSRCQQVTVSTRQEDLPEALRQALLEILTQRPGTGGIVTAFARSDQVARLLKGIKEESVDMEKELASEESRDEAPETMDARIGGRYRELRAGVVRTLMQWYRDLFVLSLGGDEDALRNQAEKAVLKPLAATLSFQQAIENIRAVDDMNRQLERNMPEAQQVLGAGFCRLVG